MALVDPENAASVRVLTKLGMALVEPVEYEGKQLAKYVCQAQGTE